MPSSRLGVGADLDGVSLSGIRQLAQALAAADEAENIDPVRIEAVRRQMVGGEYHVDAEVVAEAILDEASWVEQWLT